MLTNSNMRKVYNPIIQILQERIDQASRDWVEKGDDRALREYDLLIEEMIEIKEAIIASEDK